MHLLCLPVVNYCCAVGVHCNRTAIPASQCKHGRVAVRPCSCAWQRRCWQIVACNVNSIIVCSVVAILVMVVVVVVAAAAVVVVVVLVAYSNLHIRSHLLLLPSLFIHFRCVLNHANLLWNVHCVTLQCASLAGKRSEVLIARINALVNEVLVRGEFVCSTLLCIWVAVFKP